MTTKTENENRNQNQKPADNYDQVISIGGIRGMTKDQAMYFLAQKFAFIEGRGIPAEYKSLAHEYEMIGEETTAKQLRKKAEELNNE